MKNQTKRYRIFVWLGRLVFIGVVSGALLLGGLLLWATTLDLPDFSLFAERKVSQSTKIYDRRGVLLYDVFKDIRRTIIPFDEINTNIKNASVAIEDVQFYQHHGIRPLAILRAIWTNFRTGRKTQGGSTITQQVIKNTLLSNEKTYTRKLKEWILAVKLDSAFSKEEILGLYLNESPYGGTLYGVEEAAEGFFGKHAKDVTLAEAAYLAALPQAPSYYSPYGNHRKDLDTRKNIVLGRMKDLKFITKEEYATATKEVVVFVPTQDKNIKDLTL